MKDAQVITLALRLALLLRAYEAKVRVICR